LKKSVERYDVTATGHYPAERRSRKRAAETARSRWKFGSPFVAFFRARFFCGSHLWNWHLLIPKNALLALSRLRDIRGHEAQHLLLQLGIHLVRDRHHIGKQLAKFQILHILVER